MITECDGGIALVCFVFIGLPLGSLLGSWLARREFRNQLGSKAVGSPVDHVAELLKHLPPFIVYLAAKLCVLYRLLFHKGKLLLKQLLLKPVCHPTANQDAQHRGPNSNEEFSVRHMFVVLPLNSSASRSLAALLDMGRRGETLFGRRCTRGQSALSAVNVASPNTTVPGSGSAAPNVIPPFAPIENPRSPPMRRGRIITSLLGSC